MNVDELPELERQWDSDGTADSELLLSWEIQQDDSRIRFTMQDEWAAIGDHYFVYCAWDEAGQQWYCESLEHDWKLNMSYNTRKHEVVHGARRLYDSFGEAILAAFKVPPNTGLLSQIHCERPPASYVRWPRNLEMTVRTRRSTNSITRRSTGRPNPPLRSGPGSR